MQADAWQKMSTGALLTSYDAHYRAITCLAWTNDDAALVSGSEDALLHVWSLPASVSCSSRCLAQAEYPGYLPAYYRQEEIRIWPQRHIRPYQTIRCLSQTSL